MTMAAPLVEVTALTKTFVTGQRGWGGRKPVTVQAVCGLNFRIGRGETLALVGESGCGKSTTGRLLMRLIEATSGSIVFNGTDLTTLNAAALRRERRNFQMIFQDAGSSFNPRMRIVDIVAEPLKLAGVPRAARRERAVEMLGKVGLGRYQADRRPHELSGGQRQRVGIARALIVEPQFLVCDEPVSALDVSIQAQVVNLLKDLQRDLALTYLFVSHDLRVVRHMADRVAVMYLGEIVEIGPVGAIYDDARHPYTQALLSAVPRRGRGEDAGRQILQGEIPSARNPPEGCRFHTRCPRAQEICRRIHPDLRVVAPGREAACHLI